MWEEDLRDVNNYCSTVQHTCSGTEEQKLYVHQNGGYRFASLLLLHWFYGACRTLDSFRIDLQASLTLATFLHSSFFILHSPLPPDNLQHRPTTPSWLSKGPLPFWEIFKHLFHSSFSWHSFHMYSPSLHSFCNLWYNICFSTHIHLLLTVADRPCAILFCWTKYSCFTGLLAKRGK